MAELFETTKGWKLFKGTALEECFNEPLTVLLPNEGIMQVKRNMKTSISLLATKDLQVIVNEIF